MKNVRYTMVERQLYCRGIKDSRVLDAFFGVDREDFTPSKYKQYAYVDIETPVNLLGVFMLRPYFLAKIVTKIVETNPNRLLVVGDSSHYTTAILRYIRDFECISLTEQEFLSYEKGNFDVIYFDSKIYQLSVIRQARPLLSHEGKLIYMSFPNYEPFVLQKIVWRDIEVLEKSYNSKPSKLFSWKISLKVS